MSHKQTAYINHLSTSKFFLFFLLLLINLKNWGWGADIAVLELRVSKMLPEEGYV